MEDKFNLSKWALEHGPLTRYLMFVLMLLAFSAATVLIFSNMLAMRQAITPVPLLARMTSTMRWFRSICCSCASRRTFSSAMVCVLTARGHRRRLSWP